MRYLILVFILTLSVFGCGSVISENIKKDADRTIKLPMVQANPDVFTNKKVIWGGMIISSKNLKDKTVIEVLETPLDERDRVLDREMSLGRFIIEAKIFLDTFIYRPGKEITAAGIIKEVRVQKIDETEYRYPVIEPIQMRIFEPEPDPKYSYPPPWWYYPPPDPFEPYPWGWYYPYQRWRYPPR